MRGGTPDHLTLCTVCLQEVGVQRRVHHMGGIQWRVSRHKREHMHTSTPAPICTGSGIKVDYAQVLSSM